MDHSAGQSESRITVQAPKCVCVHCRVLGDSADDKGLKLFNPIFIARWLLHLLLLKVVGAQRCLTVAS